MQATITSIEPTDDEGVRVTASFAVGNVGESYTFTLPASDTIADDIRRAIGAEAEIFVPRVKAAVAAEAAVPVLAPDVERLVGYTIEL